MTVSIPCQSICRVHILPIHKANEDIHYTITNTLQLDNTLLCCIPSHTLTQKHHSVVCMVCYKWGSVWIRFQVQFLPQDTSQYQLCGVGRHTSSREHAQIISNACIGCPRKKLLTRPSTSPCSCYFKTLTVH